MADYCLPLEYFASRSCPLAAGQTETPSTGHFALVNLPLVNRYGFGAKIS